MKERRDSLHMPWAVYGVVTILAGVLAFPGCGGSSSSGPSPVPSATPAPVTTVIARGNFAGLQPTDPEEDPEDFYILFFSTTETGTLDVTVDWTNASNDVDFLLLTGTQEQAMSPACQALDESECPLEIVTVAVSLDKPEVATLSNAAPGGYIVAVANFGTTTESGVVVVRLTT